MALPMGTDKIFLSVILLTWIRACETHVAPKLTHGAMSEFGREVRSNITGSFLFIRRTNMTLNFTRYM